MNRQSMKTCRPMPARNRGFALILVIWALMILLGLSTGFAMAVRHETAVATDTLRQAESDAIATAARHLAVLEMNRRDPDARWLPDGRWRELQWSNAKITVRLRSESGRIDINRAPRVVLLGLLEQLAPTGDPEALADTLIDWRDRDDRPSPSGAEEAAYRAAGLGYGPANRPFISINELGRVLGFDDRLIDALRPYLTVHSRRPRINAMSAEATVLAALPGIDISTAEQFAQQRNAAYDGGENPSLAMLKEGRRFVEMQLDTRVVAIDIIVTLPDTTPHIEQVVMALARDGGYRLLARETRPSTNNQETDTQ